MLSQFPAIEPYNHFMLPVDKPHEIYVEECGNPKGLPILFIHGGPGAGCFPSDRRFFDPGLYRIILFDQRGAGRSTPHALLEKNTTQDLIADIELIRQKLNIKQWVVFGGSWGSSLSLTYAQAHPEHVLGLILRGIFLVRPEEIDWFYGAHGAANLFPDYYEDYAEPIPENERGDMISAYYKALTSDDEIYRMHAAKAWSTWEGRCSTLEPNPEKVQTFANPHVALSLARIECHYFKHDCFLKPNQLLANMDKIAHIPGQIIHGRYDVVCPISNAWQLHKAWPKSQLSIVRDAGHSSGEPGIVDALIRATNDLAMKRR